MKAFFQKHLGSGMAKTVKLIFLCVFGFLFLWFFLPIPVYGVLNIGNATGMLGFGLCCALTLFLNPFIAFLRRIWKPVFGKLLLIAAAAVVLSVLVTAGVLGCRMLAAVHRMPAGDETVVVLGCQVRGTGPSLSLSRRIAAAKTYLESHPDAKCVLSGGQGSDEDVSEAQCMFNELTNAGIDARRLYMEDRSTSTRENLAYSMTVIEEKGLSKKIALVTDGYHQCRAALIARDYTESVAAVPAKTPIILLPTYTVRELYGVLYETLRGAGKSEST